MLSSARLIFPTYYKNIIYFDFIFICWILFFLAHFLQVFSSGTHSCWIQITWWRCRDQWSRAASS